MIDEVLFLGLMLLIGLQIPMLCLLLGYKFGNKIKNVYLNILLFSFLPSILFAVYAFFFGITSSPYAIWDNWSYLFSREIYGFKAILSAIYCLFFIQLRTYCIIPIFRTVMFVILQKSLNINTK